MYAQLALGLCMALAVSADATCKAEAGALKSCQDKPRLWYFNFQGKAETIRFLLGEAKVDFHEVHVSKTGAEWNQIEGMPHLPEYLPFRQAPLYEDGEVKMSQSMAIIRYLAKKYGFYGRTRAEEAYIDMMADGGNDVYDRLTKIFYAKEESKAEMIKTFREVDGPKFVGSLDRLLGEAPKAEGEARANFFVGNALSYADMHIYFVLETVPKVAPYLLEGYPNLTHFIRTMGQRPAIAARVGDPNRAPTYEAVKA